MEHQTTPPPLPGNEHLATPPPITDKVDDEIIDLTGFDIYYQNEFKEIIESDKAYKGKWNWNAFLFSWIWLFSKGAWMLALTILISIIILISKPYFLIIVLLWAIQCGRRGTWVYYHVKIKNKQMPKSLL